MSSSNSRRRTRPLELFEHDCVDTDRPLEFEMLLDEHEYRMKWPSAPLTRFLAQTTAAASTTASGSGGGQTARTQQQKQLQRAVLRDRVVVPYVFVDEGHPPATTSSVSGHDAADASCIPTATAATASSSWPLVLPPPSRWDGEPSTLFVFSDAQIQQLSDVGFPLNAAAQETTLGECEAAFADGGRRHQLMLGALWCEAGVWISYLEHRAHQETLGKTLTILKMMPLEQAVPASLLQSQWERLQTATWLGSLTWRGVQALYDQWLRWRRRSSSTMHPWGVALMPHLHVSLPLDEFFLSQEAAAATASCAASERTTPHLILMGADRRRLLPDFGLRLQRERREGAAKTVFGYLPYNMSDSTCWSQQQNAWSLFAVGRRAITAKEVESLVAGLPHPSDAATTTATAATNPSSRATTAGTSTASRYAAAETMLERELPDARRLLSLKL